MQETLGFCSDKRIWSSINECNKMLPKTMFAIVKKNNNGCIHHIDINGRVSLSFHIRKNDRERIKYRYHR